MEIIAYICFTLSICILINTIFKLHRLMNNYINHVNNTFYDIKNIINDIKEQQTNEINGLARLENKAEILFKNDVNYYEFIKKVDESFFNKIMINKEDVAFDDIIVKLNDNNENEIKNKTNKNNIKL